MASKRNTNSKIPLLLIVIIVVVVIGFAYMFYNKVLLQDGFVSFNTPGYLSNDKSQNINIKIDDWETFTNDSFGISIKYPKNYQVTKRLDPNPSTYPEQYATFIFSNKPLHAGKWTSIQEATAGSKGTSTLQIQKVFVNSINNPKGIMVIGIPDKAKQDLREFAKTWSQKSDVTVSQINNIEMLRSKDEACSLMSIVTGGGVCSSVFFKSKDGNYYKIDIFINHSDNNPETAIFNKMISTIQLLD